ncbi:hypothetical protein DFH11DRAFT_1879693 [Phellopilus nigrolimitatus]|nr:hypothetical protein DFH11DRAFT_1879693 [Phellopilus nigrolimitatus]
MKPRSPDVDKRATDYCCGASKRVWAGARLPLWPLAPLCVCGSFVAAARHINPAATPGRGAHPLTHPAARASTYPASVRPRILTSLTVPATDLQRDYLSTDAMRAVHKLMYRPAPCASSSPAGSARSLATTSSPSATTTSTVFDATTDASTPALPLRLARKRSPQLPAAHTLTLPKPLDGEDDAPALHLHVVALDALDIPSPPPSDAIGCVGALMLAGLPAAPAPASVLLPLPAASPELSGPDTRALAPTLDGASPARVCPPFPTLPIACTPSATPASSSSSSSPSLPLPTTPPTEFRPLGPRHLEHSYHAAYTAFRLALALAYYALYGIAPPLRAPTPIARPPFARARAALLAVPGVRKAARAVDAADADLEEALKRGELWANTPVPDEWRWGSTRLQGYEWAYLAPAPPEPAPAQVEPRVTRSGKRRAEAEAAAVLLLLRSEPGPQPEPGAEDARMVDVETLSPVPAPALAPTPVPTPIPTPAPAHAPPTKDERRKRGRPRKDAAVGKATSAAGKKGRAARRLAPKPAPVPVLSEAASSSSSSTSSTPPSSLFDAAPRSRCSSPSSTPPPVAEEREKEGGGAQDEQGRPQKRCADVEARAGPAKRRKV